MMAVLHYNFHSHTKITGLPKATVGVYALALSYASGNLTDGFVPNDYARHLDAKRQHFGRLIAAGLMAERPGGYQIHDYLDYNPSKAVVVEKRRLARERMNKVRANKPAKTPKGSREQKEDVTPNVRDIGKDNNTKTVRSDVVEDVAALDLEALSQEQPSTGNVVPLRPSRGEVNGRPMRDVIGGLLGELRKEAG